MIDVYGEDVYFCSNDKKNWTFDFLSMNDFLKKNNSFRILNTGTSKKPFNHLNILFELNKLRNNNYETNNLCFIGDRVLTDVFVAEK